MERIQAAIRKAKEQRELQGTDGTETAAVAQAMPVQAEMPEQVKTAPPTRDTVTKTWKSLEPIVPSPTLMRRNRIVALDRSTPEHVTFDMLRTKVLRVMGENDWTTMAVISPTSDCGKTMVSLNLVFSLSHRKDSRVVLMELDLRRPNVQKTLGLSGAHSMADFLQGEGSITDHFVRYQENLAIGANEHPAQHTAELLQYSVASQSLARVKKELKPDIIVLDMPPMLVSDDVMAFMPNVDCALLIAAAETSTIAEIDKCERDLAEQTNVLGVILNKCRYMDKKPEYYY